MVSTSTFGKSAAVKLFWIPLVLLTTVSPCVAGSTEALRINFVEIVQKAPTKIRPPLSVTQTTPLGVLIRGLTGSEDVEFVVSLFTDGNADGVLDETEIVERVRMDRVRFMGESLSSGGDALVVPLPPIPFDERALQLEASLRSSAGAFLTRPSYLTLRKQSVLERLLPAAASVGESGLRLLRRVIRIAEVVRGAKGQRSMYGVELVNGRPKGLPRYLVGARDRLFGLSLSPSGNFVVWVTKTVSGSKLWVSDLRNNQKTVLLKSDITLVAPRFMDEETILVGKNNTLVSISRKSPNLSSVLHVSSGRISEIYRVRRLGDRRQAWISAVVPNTAGLDVTLPGVVTFGNAGNDSIFQRLPESELFPLLVGIGDDQNIIYFTGEEGGVEGVYSLSLKNKRVDLVVRCSGPGLLSISQDGRYLAFAAEACP